MGVVLTVVNNLRLQFFVYYDVLIAFLCFCLHFVFGAIYGALVGIAFVVFAPSSAVFSSVAE